MALYRTLEELYPYVGVAPPAVLSGIKPGDTVRVKASCQYRGPAQSDFFRAAIGNLSATAWDEIWAAQTPVSLPESATFVSLSFSADILITQVGLLPWTPGIFDLRCKLNANIAKGALVYQADCIEISLVTEFQLFKIDSYEKV